MAFKKAKAISFGSGKTLADVFRGPRRQRPVLVGAPKATPVPEHRITPVQVPYTAKTQRFMPNPGKQSAKFAPTI